MSGEFQQRLDNQFHQILKLDEKKGLFLNFKIELKKKNLLDGFFQIGLENNKLNFLKFLFNEFDNIVLKYSENPKTERQIGSWNFVAENYFSLSEKSDLDFKKFYNFLKLGDWKFFFLRDNLEVSKIKDLNSDEQTLIKNGVICFLDSFFDNLEWEFSLARIV